MCNFALVLTKTEAIVLHALKYGESKLIIDLFTREHGRLSCIASIPKSGKGKLKKPLFQPLALIEVDCDLRPNVQLQKLREARMAYPLTGIPFDAVKLSIALFVAEFLYHALRGEQQNVQMFDYISHSIRWLDGTGDGVANFHLTFLMRLSRFLGFYPNLDSYESGAYFDLRESVFCQYPPLHRDFLDPQEAERMGTLMRMDFATMHLFRMNRTERNRCLDVMLTYYRLHIPAFPELKSLAVLQELFA